MKISGNLLKKYNQPGPRYTSYPPANLFNDQYTENDALKAIKTSNNKKPENISIYIHIPFCPVLCHFCGCNTMIGKNEKTINRYINALKKEIKKVSELLDEKRKVSQVHWGGGTPNSIPIDKIAEIVHLLKKEFSFTDDSEIAIECSPAYLEFQHIEQLKKLGFNRISLGIQDFDEKVLEIINRKPSKYPIRDLIKHIRSTGFKSVNLDLIYGLPTQTIKSFKRNLEIAVDIHPERLVTFSYAHVPWVKKAQKLLEKYKLPSPDVKMQMLLIALSTMSENGYVPIGIDHFALPEDNLSKAYKIKKLHRNFQGYCTRETTGQVYAFGASAITQLENAYFQNDKRVMFYIKSLEENKIPTSKGYELSSTELVVRDAVNSIMCNGYLDFSELAGIHRVSISAIKKTLEFKEEKIMDMIHDQLVSMTNEVIVLSETGKLFARNVAMLIDPMLKVQSGMYSKTV